MGGWGCVPCAEQKLAFFGFWKLPAFLDLWPAPLFKARNGGPAFSHPLSLRFWRVCLPPSLTRMLVITFVPFGKPRKSPHLKITDVSHLTCPFCQVRQHIHRHEHWDMDTFPQAIILPTTHTQADFRQGLRCKMKKPSHLLSGLTGLNTISKVMFSDGPIGWLKESAWEHDHTNIR